MSTEPPGNAEQQWGARQPAQPWGAEQPGPPRRPKWSGRKTAAAVAIAVAIAAGGGAAIYAATANDAGTGPGGRGGYGDPGFGPGFGPGGGRMRGGLGAGALANALHGEFVMADGSTQLLQTGKVTSIGAGSIAVTSTDGYAKTYVINGSTAIDGGANATDAIKTGDQVTVIAKQSDNTVVSIVDQSARPQDGRQGQQQPPGGQQPPR